MSADEKNDKIATLIGGVFKPCECGFENCRCIHHRWHWNPDANPWNQDWHTDSQTRPNITDDRPDFIHDLNAMHKAELTMSQGMLQDYLSNLLPMMKEGPYETNEDLWIARSIRATAEQRAEAFILTMENQ